MNKQFLVSFILHVPLKIRIFTLVITKGEDARNPRKYGQALRPPAG